MARLNRRSEDQWERIEWQLDQVRQGIVILAGIALIGFVGAFVLAMTASGST